MEAFLCITLSIIVLRSWWKNRNKNDYFNFDERYAATFDMPEPSTAEKESEKLRVEVERRKAKDIEDLKKQGYTDELIAVILPTINDGK